tara:strand:- start:627 stop:1433 length:807 start_codon:yes stop_codon:yes gene_type:complete
MILTFITISSNLEELFTTLSSVKEVIDSINSFTFKHVFVIPKGLNLDQEVLVTKLTSNPLYHVCRDDNHGVYNALNIGILKALEIKSSYIAFINAGDLLQNGFLSSLDIIKRKPKAIVGGYNEVISSDYSKILYITKPGAGRRIFSEWNIHHQGSVYPAFVFRDRLYLSYLKISADWHFNYSIRNLYEFYSNESIVASFRLGGISTMSNNYSNLLSDEILFIKRNFINYINPFNFFYPIRLFSIFQSFAKIKMIHSLRNIIKYLSFDS